MLNTQLANISNRLLQLKHSRKTVIEYLALKLDDEDWRGVQDAASHLRDIDAEIKGLEIVSASR